MANSTEETNGDKVLDFVLDFQRAGQQACAALESFVADFNGAGPRTTERLSAAVRTRRNKYVEHARDQLLINVRRQIDGYDKEKLFAGRSKGSDGYLALLQLLQDDGVDSIERTVRHERTIATEGAGSRRIMPENERRDQLIGEELRRGQIGRVRRENVEEYTKYRTAVVEFSRAAIASLARTAVGMESPERELIMGSPNRIVKAQRAGYAAYLHSLTV